MLVCLGVEAEVESSRISNNLAGNSNLKSRQSQNFRRVLRSTTCNSQDSRVNLDPTNLGSPARRRRNPFTKSQIKPGISHGDMSDDLFDADDDLFAELEASAAPPAVRQQPAPGRIQQPTPQKIQQPIPQRLDKPPPADSSAPKVVQPTPQALPQRTSGSSILVSPRQRGNPVLASLRSMPWEYSDIPADYVLGQTTCALFLR